MDSPKSHILPLTVGALVVGVGAAVISARAQSPATGFNDAYAAASARSIAMQRAAAMREAGRTLNIDVTSRTVGAGCEVTFALTNRMDLFQGVALAGTAEVTSAGRTTTERFTFAQTPFNESTGMTLTLSVPCQTVRARVTRVTSCTGDRQTVTFCGMLLKGVWPTEIDASAREG